MPLNVKPPAPESVTVPVAWMNVGVKVSEPAAVAIIRERTSSMALLP